MDPVALFPFSVISKQIQVPEMHAVCLNSLQKKPIKFASTAQKYFSLPLRDYTGLILTTTILNIFSFTFYSLVISCHFIACLRRHHFDED